MHTIQGCRVGVLGLGFTRVRVYGRRFGLGIWGLGLRALILEFKFSSLKNVKNGVKGLVSMKATHPKP